MVILILAAAIHVFTNNKNVAFERSIKRCTSRNLDDLQKKGPIAAVVCVFSGILGCHKKRKSQVSTEKIITE